MNTRSQRPGRRAALSNSASAAAQSASLAASVLTGHELERGDHRLTKVDKPRKVPVVDGGPTGMEAARVAATRGHRVALAEADSRLAALCVSRRCRRSCGVSAPSSVGLRRKPALSIAAISASASTVARSVARFTVTCVTPGTPRSAGSTLPHVRGLELAGLQRHRHQPAQLAVVEQQVKVEILVVDLVS